MSRSGYSDECEHLELWRSNVKRTINGKRGQAFLRELLVSLEEMPQKRLIRGSLVECGEFCALGVVGSKRNISMDNLDAEDPAEVGAAFGISSMLAQEIVYVNDERGSAETPEQTWKRVHAWVKECCQ